ncbi:MAG: endo alpha-1,4 polygalactosaminidase [Planctomycetota bacterium]|jgi:cysteinyl-tRNA synthetase
MRVRSLVVVLVVGCVVTAPRRNPLRRVNGWVIQLQGLASPGAVERLERAKGELVVIDPARSVRGREAFPTRDVVARLQRRGKLCLAYLNVGQAEAYRTYWRSHWRAPTAERAGHPAYLLTVDPEGWPGDYPVAYWDYRWRAVLWGSPDAPLDRILADGFDGAYLDWILGFQDPTVAAAARRAGVDPARAMMELVRDLRAHARRRNPDFVLIAQNGASLVEAQPAFAAVIDAVSQEGLSFAGKADVTWDDAGAGDVAIPARGDWSTPALAASLRRCLEHDLPVFTLDYAASRKNAEQARRLSRDLGFVPFVSRTPLDRLP